MTNTTSLVPLASPSVLSARRPIALVSYDQLPPCQLEWLWPDRIAIGKLTLIVGEPGLGKGLLTVDMVARVSCGSPWPDEDSGNAPKGKAILLSNEDGESDTLVHRLQAAGANLEHVLTFDMQPDAEGSRVRRQFSLRDDLSSLEAALAGTPDCRLVVIDPLSAYLGGSDGNRNGDVRALLYPLAELAAAYHVAVVAVMHLNKNASTRAIHRTLGAQSLVAAARTVWCVVRDPQETNKRLLLPIKNNLAHDDLGLSFCLVRSEQAAAARTQWSPQSVALSVDEALRPGQRFSLGEKKYQDEENYCQAWLKDILSSGPVERRDFWLRGGHFSDSQLYRAAIRNGVIKEKQDFYNGTVWMLPEHHAEWLRKMEVKRREERRARDERRKQNRQQRNAQKKALQSAHVANHAKPRAADAAGSQRIGSKDTAPQAPAKQIHTERLTDQMIEARWADYLPSLPPAEREAAEQAKELFDKHVLGLSPQARSKEEWLARSIQKLPRRERQTMIRALQLVNDHENKIEERIQRGAGKITAVP